MFAFKPNLTLALRTSNPEITRPTSYWPDFEYGVLHNQNFIVSIYGAILERSRAKMMNIEINLGFKFQV